MKSEQVDAALRKKFFEEDRRIVFWHDEKAEFSDYLTGAAEEVLQGVEVLDLAAVGGLAAKLKLEQGDPTGKFLVYSAGQRPPAESDWLLDVRIYSEEFRADVVSIWQQELGLAHLSVCEHLERRSIFLRSKGRRDRLKQFVAPNDGAAELDLKMLAALVRAEAADFQSILRAICTSHLDEDGGFDLSSTPLVYEEIAKMELEGAFWAFAKRSFSYADEDADLAKLLRHLFVSDLLNHDGMTGLESIHHYRLPDNGTRNAAVFLTHWRDSNKHAAGYDAVADAIEDEQGIAQLLGQVSVDQLMPCLTFRSIDKRVVAGLRDRVLNERAGVDLDALEEAVRDRSAMHWLGGVTSDEEVRRTTRLAFEAIPHAARLLRLVADHSSGIRFESASDFYRQYRDELFQIDSLYRKFTVCAAPSIQAGWDLLKELKVEVENAYGQGFVHPLGVEGARLVEAGFLSEWSVIGMPPQQDFYARVVKKHLRGNERKRAYVIVSDAFRFEAAHELQARLNGTQHIAAEISAMLGVLPSYTTLGMAALLPHASLEYNKKGDVLLDGKSVASTELRDKHLKKYGGRAFQANDLLPLKKAEAREAVKGASTVYLYHNVVDARGDTRSTESETFQAVDSCIEELRKIVAFCIHTLNASTVWVTADHGFLFEERTPEGTDRSGLREVPDGAVKSKKRYVIAPELGTSPEVHHGNTELTAGAEGGMEFWIPRGANRFHFVGGARFVHGGAMPQEVVVPLITVNHVRGKSRSETRTKKVGLTVLGTNHRITVPRYRFEILQTEPVSDRHKAVTVRAAVYDGADPVTTIETASFASESASLDERKQDLMVELKSGYDYDPRKQYRFVVRDAETDGELASLLVYIDRSFEADF